MAIGRRVHASLTEDETNTPSKHVFEGDCAHLHVPGNMK